MPKAAAALRQRADYTHQFNLKAGRHGWLRLTPAYSVKVVAETISRYGSRLNVLDPFCGTGTTALCAAAQGHRATTVDINPFLTWLAGVKTSAYSAQALADAERAGLAALELTRRGAIAPAPVPSIHRIERWWPEAATRFLASLRDVITASSPDERVRNLLLVAFWTRRDRQAGQTAAGCPASCPASWRTSPPKPTPTGRCWPPMSPSTAKTCRGTSTACEGC